MEENLLTDGAVAAAPVLQEPAEGAVKKKKQKRAKTMKAIGTEQFLQKKYDTITWSRREWMLTLGEMERNTIGIIYGPPGNGKTDVTVQMLKEVITSQGDAAWLDYEERHRKSLQNAVKRHLSDATKYRVTWQDPLHNLQLGDNVVEELFKYLGKKSTPKYVFINSLNYLRMTLEQYYELERRFKGRKFIVFLSHAKGKQPDTKVGEKILYDGDFGIYVRNYIAWPQKSRFGGFEPYVIYEEKARELNELWFAKRDGAGPKKRGRKPGKK